MEIAANHKDVSFNKNIVVLNIVFRFCDGKMTKTNLLS